MLDEDRAGLLAPAAGGAGPDRLVGQHAAFADQRRQLLDQLGGKLQPLREGAFGAGRRVGVACLRMAVSVAVGVAAAGDRRDAVHPAEERAQGQRHLVRDLLRVVADGAVHFLVGERLAGLVGGAIGLAAAAFGAGIGIEDFLPGEIGQLRHAKLFRIFQIQFGKLPLRREPLEVDGGQAGDDVEMLSQREEIEKHHHDGDVREHARRHQIGRGARRHSVEECRSKAPRHRQVPGHLAGALRQKGSVDQDVAPEDAEDHH